MIAQAFEDYLVKQEGAFLTPAANLAVLVDSHNVDHAILLLSQMTYSRIPVVTDEKKFVGTISLTDIMAYRMQHDLPEEEKQKIQKRIKISSAMIDAKTN